MKVPYNRLPLVAALAAMSAGFTQRTPYQLAQSDASSGYAAVKDAVENLGKSWKEYKDTNDERVKAIKDGNETKARELGEKLERIESDVSKFSTAKKAIEDEIKAQRDRIEELESRSKQPGATQMEKVSGEYKAAFIQWVRGRGQDASAEAKMKEAQTKAAELGKSGDVKGVTIASAAGGGYAVPEEISRMIEVLEKKFSPVRDLVKVVQAGTSDYKELVNIRGATSGWVGESGSRSATNTPQLREVVPTHGELYAYPQASEWSLDDIFFNVEDWLATEVADAFSIAESTAVITGSGSNQPTGMLHTAPVTTADFASPLRAAAAYQYVASDASPVGIVADSLIDLVYTLNSRYRAGAVFAMNSLTTGAVRKLKDGNDQYIWAPGLQANQPDRLLGYAVSTWEQLDDIGSNKYPVLFGNFKRAYVLADRVGLRITRDNVTSIGFVKFYVRRREGGIVLNNDALKVLKTV